MDLVTHAALGAAIGEAILGKKLGRRAMLWGAVAGSFPDLDVLLTPFEDDIGFLTYHRGVTHSILFLLVASPFLGWLASRWLRRRWPEITTLRCIGLALAGLASHIFLDACTNYGTQLFLPFSNYRVALNNIFIIDPLFTFPLLVSGIVCLVLKRMSGKRRVVNFAGLALSCLYLAVTVVNESEARHVFAASLADQHIQSQRLMTGPTPFNSILWYGIAEDQDGFHIGYYSLFDRQKQVHFSYVPRNESLLEGFKGRRAVKRLVWFSNGYYTVHEEAGRLIFDVLKFGVLSLDADDSHVAYSFIIQPDEQGNLRIWNATRRRDVNVGHLMAALWGRIKSREPATF